MNFPTAVAKNPAPLRVLVVDDEPLIRWSLAEVLGESGHLVTEACDAASAVRAVSDNTLTPDVVLLDFRLPDSNDLGLLSTIRRTAPAAQVILMTAYGTADVVKGALDLGVYRVVNKPFEVHDLAALVEQAHDSRPQPPTPHLAV